MEKTTKTTTTTALVSQEALAELRLFVKDAGAAAKSAQSASRHLIRAAIMGRGHFEATVLVLYEEIRTDANGIAVRCGAERNDEDDGFVVPGSIRAQVAQMKRALENGVDLGTIDKPRKPTEIRNDAKEAADKKAEAAKTAVPLTGDALLKATVLLALTDAEAVIKASAGPKLAALALAANVFSAQVTQIHASYQTKAPEAKPVEPTAAASATIAPAAMPEATGAMLPNGKAGSRKSRRAA